MTTAAEKAKQRADANRFAAQNRRARFDYDIKETFEAGIALWGSEVKSLRRGQASIGEAFATEKSGEIFLINMHIPEYAAAKRFSHEPRRPRKLLLHKREMAKMLGAVKREGMAIVPLSIYFNDRGIAKVSLALARGKRKVDAREAVKEREWKRQQGRLLRARG